MQETLPLWKWTWNNLKQNWKISRKYLKQKLIVCLKLCLFEGTLRLTLLFTEIISQFHPENNLKIHLMCKREQRGIFAITITITQTITVYTTTWLLRAFLLVVDLLKDTHRWRQIHVRSRQQTCFSFFMPPKSFNKPFEFLLYETNRLYFVCV